MGFELLTWKQAQKILIDEHLRYFNGNKMHAALSLGISVRTLRNKIRSLGLTQWKIEAPRRGKGA